MFVMSFRVHCPARCAQENYIVYGTTEYRGVCKRVMLCEPWSKDRILGKNLNIGLGQGSLWLVWLSTVVHDAVATRRPCGAGWLIFLSFFLSVFLYLVVWVENYVCLHPLWREKSKKGEGHSEQKDK